MPEQSRPKNGGCCALSAGGAGSTSNTMWPGLRPTSVPSGILIHPAIWTQYTNVTDRQDRQDNGPIAFGEPLLVMVPKNYYYLFNRYPLSGRTQQIIGTENSQSGK